MKFRLVEQTNETFIKEPIGKSFGIDTCVISAISNAYNLTWDETWRLFSDYFDIRDLENKGISQKYYGPIISRLGFVSYQKISKSITVQDFSQKYTTGVFLVCCSDTSQNIHHMTCIKDGNIYDTFNSSKFIVDSFYTIRES